MFHSHCKIDYTKLKIHLLICKQQYGRTCHGKWITILDTLWTKHFTDSLMVVWYEPQADLHYCPRPAISNTTLDLTKNSSLAKSVICSTRNHRTRHHCLFPRKKEKLKWNSSLPRRCMCNNILQLRQHIRLRKKKSLKTFSIPFFLSPLSLYLSSHQVLSISPKYLPAHFVSEKNYFTNIYAQPMP